MMMMMMMMMMFKRIFLGKIPQKCTPYAPNGDESTLIQVMDLRRSFGNQSRSRCPSAAVAV